MLETFLRVTGVLLGRHDVVGINARNRTLIYQENPRRYYPLADDKLRTKEILRAEGIPVPETLGVFSWMHELPRVESTLKDIAEFVIKPSQGKAGNGILVIVDYQRGQWLDAGGAGWSPDAVTRHIGDIIFGNYAHGLSDRALIEERLVQASLFGEVLFPGLPDIRIITHNGRQIMAMLRVPTTRSGGKANLHQGAIGVGIDLETGRTTFACHRGKFITDHPDGLGQLTDRKLAAWPEVLDLARRTAAALPLGYLGIDVSIDRRRGPLVLEVNVRPGLEIQNANRQGLGPLVTGKALGEAEL